MREQTYTYYSNGALKTNVDKNICNNTINKYTFYYSVGKKVEENCIVLNGEGVNNALIENVPYPYFTSQVWVPDSICLVSNNTKVPTVLFDLKLMGKQSFDWKLYITKDKDTTITDFKCLKPNRIVTRKHKEQQTYFGVDSILFVEFFFGAVNGWTKGSDYDSPNERKISLILLQKHNYDRLGYFFYFFYNKKGYLQQIKGYNKMNEKENDDTDANLIYDEKYLYNCMGYVKKKTTMNLRKKEFMQTKYYYTRHKLVKQKTFSTLFN